MDIVFYCPQTIKMIVKDYLILPFINVMQSTDYEQESHSLGEYWIKTFVKNSLEDIANYMSTYFERDPSGNFQKDS